MNIAILSDLHGNIDAVNAVFETFEKELVNEIIILGDIVGYYYYPEKILQLLKSYKCKIIRGNHEIILNKILNNSIDRGFIIEKYGHGHEYALEKLSESEINYLISLPDELEFTIENNSFLLRHANPWNLEDYIYENSNQNILKNIVSGEYNYTLLGHTHYSFDFKFNDKILINPGSIGQNRKKGGIASWVIFDTNTFRYKFMNTKYCISKLVNQVKLIDSKNEYLYKVLER